RRGLEETASRPGAFVVVFLPMAAVALAGAWVATRLHAPAAPTAPGPAADADPADTSAHADQLTAPVAAEK
ncbi:hypothetical protein GPJ59_27020, partial [Streptomyces bambusae]|nr:hypothetical protein [Streptomyces bambusae]